MLHDSHPGTSLRAAPAARAPAQPSSVPVEDGVLDDDVDFGEGFADAACRHRRAHRGARPGGLAREAASTRSTGSGTNRRRHLRQLHQRAGRRSVRPAWRIVPSRTHCVDCKAAKPRLKPAGPDRDAARQRRHRRRPVHRHLDPFGRCSTRSPTAVVAYASATHRPRGRAAHPQPAQAHRSHRDRSSPGDAGGGRSERVWLGQAGAGQSVRIRAARRGDGAHRPRRARHQPHPGPGRRATRTLRPGRLHASTSKTTASRRGCCSASSS